MKYGLEKEYFWVDVGLTNSQYPELIQPRLSYCLAAKMMSLSNLNIISSVNGLHTQQWIELYDPLIVCPAENLLAEFPE